MFFKWGMQSLALRTSSGGQCLLFEEMCLGGKVISWAAFEFCCYHGVLPCLKSLPTARELQLLGKAAEQVKPRWAHDREDELLFCARWLSQKCWAKLETVGRSLQGGEWPLTQPAGNSWAQKWLARELLRAGEASWSSGFSCAPVHPTVRKRPISQIQTARFRHRVSKAGAPRCWTGDVSH